MARPVFLLPRYLAITSLRLPGGAAQHEDSQNDHLGASQNSRPSARGGTNSWIYLPLLQGTVFLQGSRHTPWKCWAPFRQLQSLCVFDIVLKLNNTAVIPVLLDNITNRPESLPPYLTCRCNIKGLYEGLSKEAQYEPQANLFDFGSGVSFRPVECSLITDGSMSPRQGDDSRDLVCVGLSCAPEFLRTEIEDKGHVLDPGSDICAIGTVVSVLIEGCYLVFVDGSWIWYTRYFCPQIREAHDQIAPLDHLCAALD